ncbi:MAG: hypothetical protein RI556_12790, partial [Hydrogenovibrio sp.]|uniref:hypothetical protein n=1 Tax=Hydrogenovibrio sp. TaxID=2065821 RepID=UPI00286FC723
MSSSDPARPMLSLLAASGDQRVYFEALSDALNARGVSAHCVFYQSLPKLRWLIDCFRPLPTHVVERIDQQVSILQA